MESARGYNNFVLFLNKMKKYLDVNIVQSLSRAIIWSILFVLINNKESQWDYYY